MIEIGDRNLKSESVIWGFCVAFINEDEMCIAQMSGGGNVDPEYFRKSCGAGLVGNPHWFDVV
ncbi:hypothetical protein CULCOIPH002_21450 [Corynebacterium ulcerans]|nr:hypothetical protein CULCOIPH001_19290 [Corynebacterium ulcerans]GJJ37233.1 hypothetical protein CULCOIPH002_21450 [Corynebacterium ulcerans]GJJ41675.1 hypothetical protein CULCOIPH004_20860 [Corynebacterium ulcerans]